MYAFLPFSAIVDMPKLTGTLPQSIGSMTSLYFDTSGGLIINSNPGLTGTIPDSIRKLTSIAVLDFHNNSLSGPVNFPCDKLTFGVSKPFVSSVDLSYNRLTSASLFDSR